MSLSNPTIPSLIRPVVPTSVPFVYRDGLTMLQLIECIKHNLDDLQTYVNGVMNNVNKALEDQTTQNQDTLDKAQQAAQDAADAIQQAQDALDQYQQIVGNVNTALTTANAAIDRLEALGVADPETATTLKNTIQQTATDLTALEQRVTDAETTLSDVQSLAQTNESDIAGIDANLNALGVNGVTEATQSKDKWDTAATDAQANAANIVKNTNDITRNIKIIKNSIGYNDNIVVIGDSWVDGYYSGAKHLADSPANAIYDILSPSTKQTLGTSAGGFYASGDNGTFLDRWNTVSDKSSVDRVIIIGGQNDAGKLQSGSPGDDIQSKIISTLTTISQEAPNAIIDVFPMCLAVGESMSRQTNQIQGDSRTIVYKMFTHIDSIPNLVIHEGAYRAGVWASYASDGGSDDGAHLSKLGYVEFGHAVGSCILHGKTFFPTTDGGATDSQLPGTWQYINIFETNGVLSISYNIRLSASVSNGNRIFNVPKCFSVGAPRYWRDFDSKYFVSMNGNTLALQGVSGLASGDLVVGNQTMLSGF